MTNPSNAVGTNGAYGGRTSVQAFNDMLSMFNGRGILNGWEIQPAQAMTVQIGGATINERDVAIAENPSGDLVSVNNISREPVMITIPTASTDIDRTDAIVAYVTNPPQSKPTITDNYDACGVIAVVGDANGAPDEATIRAAITADGGTGTTAYYVMLGTVFVPQNATVVTDVAQGDQAVLKSALKVDIAIKQIDPYTAELTMDTVDGPATVRFGGNWQNADEMEF